MKKIGIFDIQFSIEERAEFYKYCETIFDEGYLTNHSFNHIFNKTFSEFCGSAHALLTPSGTSALELALRVINIKNKKVLLPVNTFIATAVAVINAGGIPVFLDIEDDYYGLCPVAVKKSLSSEIGAVITVHIGGHISPRIKEIKALCESSNISLIEDSAHAHGASLDGIRSGNFGRFGCFSHFLTKIMTTGEGGSLIMNDKNDFERAVSLHRFGFDPKNSILHTEAGGSNFKVSEFQAALGVVELGRIDKRIEKRRLIASLYKERLAGTNWKVQSDSKGSIGSYYKQILLPPSGVSRETVEQHLLKNEIPLTGEVYRIPLNKQPAMKFFAGEESFPISDQFCENHICPPCYPELEVEQIDFICSKLREL